MNTQNALLSLLISFQLFTSENPILLTPENLDQYPELVDELGRSVRRLARTAYVISITKNSKYVSDTQLQKSEERTASLIPVLNEMGLETRLIDAVTPLDVDPESWQKLQEIYQDKEFFNRQDWPQQIDERIGTKEQKYWRRADNWSRKVPGQNYKVLDPKSGIYQLACAESHIKTLKQALREAQFSDKHPLILEDDANFAVSREIINRFNQAISDLEKRQWTYFKLGLSFWKENAAVNPMQIGWQETECLTKLLGSQGTFAEIINRNELPRVCTTYEQYLAGVKSDPSSVIYADDVIQRQQELAGESPTYATNPTIVGQGHAYSTLCEKDMDYNQDAGLLRHGLICKYPTQELMKRRPDGFCEYIGSELKNS